MNLFNQNFSIFFLSLHSDCTDVMPVKHRYHVTTNSEDELAFIH